MSSPLILSNDKIKRSNGRDKKRDKFLRLTCNQQVMTAVQIVSVAILFYLLYKAGRVWIDFFSVLGSADRPSFALRYADAQVKYPTATRKFLQTWFFPGLHQITLNDIRRYDFVEMILKLQPFSQFSYEFRDPLIQQHFTQEQQQNVFDVLFKKLQQHLSDYCTWCVPYLTYNGTLSVSSSSLSLFCQWCGSWIFHSSICVLSVLTFIINVVIFVMLSIIQFGQHIVIISCVAYVRLIATFASIVGVPFDFILWNVLSFSMFLFLSSFTLVRLWFGHAIAARKSQPRSVLHFSRRLQKLRGLLTHSVNLTRTRGLQLARSLSQGRGLLSTPSSRDRNSTAPNNDDSGNSSMENSSGISSIARRILTQMKKRVGAMYMYEQHEQHAVASPPPPLAPPSRAPISTSPLSASSSHHSRYTTLHRYHHIQQRNQLLNRTAEEAEEEEQSPEISSSDSDELLLNAKPHSTSSTASINRSSNNKHSFTRHDNSNSGIAAITSTSSSTAPITMESKTADDDDDFSIFRSQHIGSPSHRQRRLNPIKALNSISIDDAASATGKSSSASFKQFDMKPTSSKPTTVSPLTETPPASSSQSAVFLPSSLQHTHHIAPFVSSMANYHQDSFYSLFDSSGDDEEDDDDSDDDDNDDDDFNSDSQPRHHSSTSPVPLSLSASSQNVTPTVLSPSFELPRLPELEEFHDQQDSSPQNHPPTMLASVPTLSISTNPNSPLHFTTACTSPIDSSAPAASHDDTDGVASTAEISQSNHQLSDDDDDYGDDDDDDDDDYGDDDENEHHHSNQDHCDGFSMSASDIAPHLGPEQLSFKDINANQDSTDVDVAATRPFFARGFLSKISRLERRGELEDMMEMFHPHAQIELISQEDIQPDSPTTSPSSSSKPPFKSKMRLLKRQYREFSSKYNLWKDVFQLRSLSTFISLARYAAEHEFFHDITCPVYTYSKYYTGGPQFVQDTTLMNKIKRKSALGRVFSTLLATTSNYNHASFVSSQSSTTTINIPSPLPAIATATPSMSAPTLTTSSSPPSALASTPIFLSQSSHTVGTATTAAATPPPSSSDVIVLPIDLLPQEFIQNAMFQVLPICLPHPQSSDVVLQRLMQAITLCAVRRGVELTTQGQPATAVFLLCEGEAWGKSSGLIVRHYQQGDFVGADALASLIPSFDQAWLATGSTPAAHIPASAAAAANGTIVSTQTVTVSGLEGSHPTDSASLLRSLVSNMATYPYLAKYNTQQDHLQEWLHSALFHNDHPSSAPEEHHLPPTNSSLQHRIEDFSLVLRIDVASWHELMQSPILAHNAAWGVMGRAASATMTALHTTWSSPSYDADVSTIRVMSTEHANQHILPVMLKDCLVDDAEETESNQTQPVIKSSSSSSSSSLSPSPPMSLPYKPYRDVAVVSNCATVPFQLIRLKPGTLLDCSSCLISPYHEPTCNNLVSGLSLAIPGKSMISHALYPDIKVFQTVSPWFIDAINRASACQQGYIVLQGNPYLHMHSVHKQVIPVVDDQSDAATGLNQHHVGMGYHFQHILGGNSLQMLNLTNGHRRQLISQQQQQEQQQEQEQQSTTTTTPSSLPATPHLASADDYLFDHINLRHRILSHVSTTIGAPGCGVNLLPLLTCRPQQVLGIGNPKTTSHNNHNNSKSDDVDDDADDGKDDVILLVVHRHDLDIFLHSQSYLSASPPPAAAAAAAAATTTIATTTTVSSQTSATPELSPHAMTTPIKHQFLHEIFTTVISSVLQRIYALLYAYTRLGLRFSSKPSDGTVMRGTSPVGNEISLITSGKCMVSLQPLKQVQKLLTHGNVRPETTIKDLRDNPTQNEVVVCNCYDEGRHVHVNKMHIKLHHFLSMRHENFLLNLERQRLSEQISLATAAQNVVAAALRGEISPHPASSSSDDVHKKLLQTAISSQHIPSIEAQLKKTPIHHTDQSPFRVSSAQMSVEAHKFQTKVAVGDVIGLYHTIRATLMLLSSYHNLNVIPRTILEQLNAYFCKLRQVQSVEDEESTSVFFQQQQYSELEQAMPACLRSSLSGMTGASNILHVTSVHDTECISFSLGSLLLFHQTVPQSVYIISERMLQHSQQISQQAQEFCFSPETQRPEALLQATTAQNRVPSKVANILTFIDASERHMANYSHAQLSYRNVQDRMSVCALLDRQSQGLSSQDLSSSSSPAKDTIIDENDAKRGTLLSSSSSTTSTPAASLLTSLPIDPGSGPGPVLSLPTNDMSLSIPISTPFSSFMRQLIDDMRQTKSVISIQTDDCYVLLGYYSYRFRFEQVLSIVFPNPHVLARSCAKIESIASKTKPATSLASVENPFSLLLSAEPQTKNLICRHLLSSMQFHTAIDKNVDYFLFATRHPKVIELDTYRIGLHFDVLEACCDVVVCQIEQPQSVLETFAYINDLNTTIQSLVQLETQPDVIPEISPTIDAVTHVATHLDSSLIDNDDDDATILPESSSKAISPSIFVPHATSESLIEHNNSPVQHVPSIPQLAFGHQIYQHVLSQLSQIPSSSSPHTSGCSNSHNSDKTTSSSSSSSPKISFTPRSPLSLPHLVHNSLQVTPLAIPSEIALSTTLNQRLTIPAQDSDYHPPRFIPLQFPRDVVFNTPAERQRSDFLSMCRAPAHLAPGTKLEYSFSPPQQVPLTAGQLVFFAWAIRNSETSVLVEQDSQCQNPGFCAFHHASHQANIHELQTAPCVRISNQTTVDTAGTIPEDRAVLGRLFQEHELAAAKAAATTETATAAKTTTTSITGQSKQIDSSLHHHHHHHHHHNIINPQSYGPHAKDFTNDFSFQATSSLQSLSDHVLCLNEPIISTMNSTPICLSKTLQYVPEAPRPLVSFFEHSLLWNPNSASTAHTIDNQYKNRINTNNNGHLHNNIHHSTFPIVSQSSSSLPNYDTWLNSFRENNHTTENTSSATAATVVASDSSLDNTETAVLSPRRLASFNSDINGLPLSTPIPKAPATMNVPSSSFPLTNRSPQPPSGPIVPMHHHRYLGRSVPTILILIHGPCVTQPLFSRRYLAAGGRRIDSILHCRLRPDDLFDISVPTAASAANAPTVSVDNNDKINHNPHLDTPPPTTHPNSINNPFSHLRLQLYQCEPLDISRAVRRLLALHIGVVLGGGGARGCSHGGCLHALSCIGLSPDTIAGVSQGAFMGSVFSTVHSSLYHVDPSRRVPIGLSDKIPLPEQIYLRQTQSNHNQEQHDQSNTMQLNDKTQLYPHQPVVATTNNNTTNRSSREVLSEMSQELLTIDDLVSIRASLFASQHDDETDTCQHSTQQKEQQQCTAVDLIDMRCMLQRVQRFCIGMSTYSSLLSDATFPIIAYFSGRGMNSLVISALGLYGDLLHIEDTWTEFITVSTNVSRSCVQVHRSGVLWFAVRSSMGVLGLLPPMSDPSTRDLLIDGGYVDNLACHDLLTISAPKYCIAVDVESKDEAHLQNIEPVSQDGVVSGWSLLFKWFCRSFLPVVTSNHPAKWFYPSYGSLVSSLLFLSHGKNMYKMAKYIDCYIRPDIGHFQLLDYDKLPEIWLRGWNQSVKEMSIFVSSRLLYDQRHHQRELRHKRLSKY